MAGTGFWAKCLNEAGIQTIPYDLHTTRKHNTYGHSARHMTIKRGNALKTVNDMQRRNLPGNVMISWPPYKETTAGAVVELLPIGARIVYIGEGGGGMTGDLYLHQFLRKNCQELAVVDLPNFTGKHDYLTIYQKIKNDPADKKAKGIFMYNTYPDDEDTGE